MSAHSRSTPENLEERTRRAQYHEEQIQARKEREAEGAREWCEKHARGAGAGAPNRAPGRDKTVHEYPVL